MEEKKGIGLVGLVGMVISSCIGSGIFALTGQIAQVAAPGSALVAWLIVGLGFLFLALSLNNLTAKRSDIKGIYGYASEGFGPLAGFLSGWGYWLSAWLGNVAFATIMMSAVGYFYPPFVSGNSPLALFIASIFLWALTFLVIRGIESAAFLNALVMIAKVASLSVFIAFTVFLFQAHVFTADFWGTLHNNAIAVGAAGTDAVHFGSVGQQIINCFIIMMWVFIGIEGATVMSSRAEKKSDVGKATVIGLIGLLIIYVGASVLPFGVLPYEEIAAMDKPAMLYVFDKMAPGWGGTFITIAMIISVMGAWLSFTILPAETTNEMAHDKLVPASWGKLNKKNSPQYSLIIVGICTQLFIGLLLFSADAYNFAFSMCTVAIVITWTLAAAFQVKYSLAHKDIPNAIIGILAVAFQVIGTMFNGWSFLMLTCVGYIPGFFIYAKARKEHGKSITNGEKITMAIVTILGIASLVLLGMGVIHI